MFLVLKSLKTVKTFCLNSVFAIAHAHEVPIPPNTVNRGYSVSWFL